MRGRGRAPWKAPISRTERYGRFGRLDGNASPRSRQALPPLQPQRARALDQLRQPRREGLLRAPRLEAVDALLRAREHEQVPVGLARDLARPGEQRALGVELALVH